MGERTNGGFFSAGAHRTKCLFSVNLAGGIAELFLFSYRFVTIEEQKSRERSRKRQKDACLFPLFPSSNFSIFPVRFHDEATTSDTGSDISYVDDAGFGANEFDDHADEEDHDDTKACRQESSGGERDGSTDSGVA